METNILKKLAVSLNNTAKILIELAEISQSAATENSDYEEIKKVSDALEEKRNALEESEMRWMELSEKMEG